MAFGGEFISKIISTLYQNKLSLNLQTDALTRTFQEKIPQTETFIV